MYIHQILGTSMGTRMVPLSANLFMVKEERTIILTFLLLIYFYKRFIDDISSFSWASTPNSNP